MLKIAIALSPGHYLAKFHSVTMLHPIDPALIPMTASLPLLHSGFWLICELTDEGRPVDST